MAEKGVKGKGKKGGGVGSGELSTFEFGGAAKPGDLVMKGVCTAGPSHPEAVTACEWTVAKEKAGPKAQGQRVKIFF